MTKQMIKIICILFIFSILIPISASQDNKSSTTYRSLVDQFNGFYRVYSVISGKVAPYSNHTLNIDTGDTIVWINDGVPDTRLTIISSQKLWSNNSGDLKWAYKQFSYSFNKSGTYDVYIRQYPHFKQKIIVGQQSAPKKSNSTNATTKNATTKNATTKNATTKNATTKSASLSPTKTIIKNITTKSASYNSTKVSTKLNSTKDTITADITKSDNTSDKGLYMLILFIVLLSLIYIINKRVG